MSDATEFYALIVRRIPATKSGEFRMVTAAVRECGLCGRVISGMGGPGQGQICLPCGDALQRGQLRGAVRWEDDGK